MNRSDDGRPLRIAYVTPYDEDYPSIQDHTARRLEAWTAGGAIVSSFTIGGGGRARRGATQNLLTDMRESSSLAGDVEAFGPDVVYARWLAPVPGLYKRLRRHAPLVLEVHADDLIEVARTSHLRRAYLHTFRRKELRQASGATFVVSELAEDPSFRAIRGPRGVFGNGSWASPRTSTPSGRPRVGISTAGVNEWTGLDRFVSLALQLDDVADWVVVCPEAEEESVRAATGGAVEVVGTGGSEDYLAEVASWSVAIGTLALERKNLRTASPLKVRDYLGLAVPTVLPYWDEGAAELDHALLLKLAARDEPPVPCIDPAVLRRFIAAAHGRSLPSELLTTMSGAGIERRRMNFLRGFRAEG
jgi:hypothetical protein